MENKSTRSGFGDGLMDIAEALPHVVTIDADLRHSVQTMKFATKYPTRALQVGIAEQNMVGVAAGLAVVGKTPFAASFAVFATGLTYNQIRQSVCYSEKDVKIVGTHAGVQTGEDGATHQMLEDISLMRGLPHMEVYQPADYYEARALTRLVAGSGKPTYLRLGRADIPTLFDAKKKFKLGSLEAVHDGWKGAPKKAKKILLVATGVTVPYGVLAARSLPGLAVRVLNASSLKPFPVKVLLKHLAEADIVLTAEDHQIAGGLGSIVAEVMAENGVGKKLTRIGMKDSFGESGTWKDCLRKYGFDEAGLAKALKRAGK